MNLPKISVVVPSFNQAGYLARTLDSVLDQAYPNLELIVMDGGSTDGSREILQRYDARIDHWVSAPDGGQTNGLIAGFARSSGEIQCWLNSDDLHQPHTLREVADYFLRHPQVAAVYGDTLWIDPDDRPLRIQREIPFWRPLWLHTYNYIPGMSMFWRRAAYEAVGGLDASFNLAMDADLWARLSHHGRIAHTRRLWSCMRFYPEQKNRRLREASDREDERIRLREWGGRPPALLPWRRRLARLTRIAWRLAYGCYGWGYQPRLERLEARAATGSRRG